MGYSTALSAASLALHTRHLGGLAQAHLAPQPQLAPQG